MKSCLKLRGIFDMSVVVRGRVVERVREHNMVVNGARLALLNQLAGIPTSAAVTHIGFGTSAIAAATTDVSLADEYRRAVLSTVVSGTELQVSWLLDELEGGDLAISEFGLWTDGGLLLTRKVRPTPIAKSNATRLQGTWTLSFE